MSSYLTGKYALTEPRVALQSLYKKKLCENILSNAEISSQFILRLQQSHSLNSSNLCITEIACKLASQSIVRRSVELCRKQKKILQKCTAYKKYEN